jgi:hypothetical protein
VSGTRRQQWRAGGTDPDLHKCRQRLSWSLGSWFLTPAGRRLRIPSAECPTPADGCCGMASVRGFLVRASSSAGQSARLISVRSEVQILPGPPPTAAQQRRWCPPPGGGRKTQICPVLRWLAGQPQGV